MAVPKHKTSRSKRDHRRGHIKLQMPALSTCTNCGEMIRPHRVCPDCGHYKGVQIVEVKQKY
jgi:large subunit ribosomal protein L32